MDLTKNNFKFSSPEAKIPAFSHTSASVTQSSSNKVSLKAEIRNHQFYRVVTKLKLVLKFWKRIKVDNKWNGRMGTELLTYQCSVSTFHGSIFVQNNSEDSNNSKGNTWSDHSAELSWSVLMHWPRTGEQRNDDFLIYHWILTTMTEKKRKLWQKGDLAYLFQTKSTAYGFTIMFFNLFSSRLHFPLVNRCRLVKGKLWRSSDKGKWSQIVKMH